MGQHASFKGTEESETEILQKIKDWLYDIQIHPLPGWCSGPDEDTINYKELLIRNGPCHEKGAIKKYVQWIIYNFKSMYRFIAIRGQTEAAGILTNFFSSFQFLKSVA